MEREAVVVHNISLRFLSLTLEEILNAILFSRIVLELLSVILMSCRSARHTGQEFLTQDSSFGKNVQTGGSVVTASHGDTHTVMPLLPRKNKYDSYTANLGPAL